MTRVARVFGPLLKFGRYGLESYSSYGAFIEAAPIYQQIEISLRIWGSRTLESGSTVTSESIDQTESVIISREFSPSPPLGIPQVEFVHAPGITGSGSVGGGIGQRLGVSATIAVEELIASGDSTQSPFVLGWAEMAANPFNAAYQFSFADTPLGFPVAARQRLYVFGGQTKTFTFHRVVTPGGSSDFTQAFTLSPPRWGGLTSVPPRGRGERYGWGYSVSECIDTSAWTAEQWRDYRGIYEFPAQSMTAGWTSGDMQRQFKITLS